MIFNKKVLHVLVLISLLSITSGMFFMDAPAVSAAAAGTPACDTYCSSNIPQGYTYDYSGFGVDMWCDVQDTTLPYYYCCWLDGASCYKSQAMGYGCTDNNNFCTCSYTKACGAGTCSLGICSSDCQGSPYSGCGNCKLPTGDGGNCETCCKVSTYYPNTYQCIIIEQTCDERGMVETYDSDCNSGSGCGTDSRCCMSEDFTNPSYIFSQQSCDAYAFDTPECNTCCGSAPPIDCADGTLQSGESCDYAPPPGTSIFRATQDECSEIDSKYESGQGTLGCALNCAFDFSNCVEKPITPKVTGMQYCAQADTNFQCSTLNRPGGGEDYLCMWCPKPNPRQGYPFTLPGVEQKGVGTIPNYGCVNAIYDSMNCGECGFEDGGSQAVINGNTGFCMADQPYCISGKCKTLNEALGFCTELSARVTVAVPLGTNLSFPSSSADPQIDPYSRKLSCANEVFIETIPLRTIQEGTLSIVRRLLTGSRWDTIGSFTCSNSLNLKIGSMTTNNDVYTLAGLNSYYDQFGISGYRPIPKMFNLSYINCTSPSEPGSVYINVNRGECIPGMSRPVQVGDKWGSEYCGPGGTWTTQTPLPGTQIEPIYLLDDIDHNPTICTAMGGTDFVEGLGCCGDKQCRERGSLCHTTAICDGTKWHNGTGENGEVFTPEDCTNEWDQFPIANMDGEFVRCVDEAMIGRYVLDYDSSAPGICNATRDGNLIDPNLAGGMYYICGPGKYATAGLRALQDNICAGHGLYAADLVDGAQRKTEYVCDVSKNSLLSGEGFSFASIIDVTKDDLGIMSVIGLAEGRESMKYDNCPAFMTDWLQKNAGETTFSVAPTVAMLPCPGKIDIDLPDYKGFLYKGIDRAFGASLGDSSGRNVMVCREPLDANEEPWLYKLKSLKYFASNGSVMGDVQNHGYVCYSNPALSTQSKADIAICCGDNNCEGLSGNITGRGVTSGKSLNTSDGKTIYCFNNGTWSTDLDFNTTQDICFKADHFATGNYCCAEGDDTRTWINESYNDPGSVEGACFKGIGQANGAPLIYNGTNYFNVLVYNGSFLGCGFNNSAFYLNPEFEAGGALCVPGADGVLSQECLQGIEDWPDPGANFSADSPFRTGHSLIRATDYCTIIDATNAQIYCSYSDAWENTNGQNLSHGSVVPQDLMNYLIIETGDNTLVNSSCCLPNTCWDPKEDRCIEEQTEAIGQHYQINETAAFKCLQGTWVNVYATGKRTPDGCFAGICTGDSDCFYSPGGDPKYNYNVSGDVNPQCLADGQYLGDFVCDAGNWTTRTKILAKKLASLIDFDPTGYTEDNFVIMCGMPEQVLNSEPATGDTNTYCVMNLDGQRILGTTLNQPIYDNVTFKDFRTAIEQAFGASYPAMAGDFDFDYTCNDSGTSFEKCIDIEDYLQLYFKEEYEMVVFSDEEITGLNGGLGDAICNVLPSWLKWLCPLPSPLEQDLEDVRLFNMTFSSKVGSNKRVFGVHEQVCDPASQQHDDIFTFNYSGYTSVYLDHITDQIKAEEVVNSDKHIFIKNPDKEDAWAALTLLRNTELQ